MFPLLALGLMAGNQWLKTKRQDDKEAEAKAVLDQARDEYKQLRGESPQEMGPPDQQGVMGSTSGRGLLADPSNPQKQAEFATGIMGLRALGLEGVGGQLLSQGQQRYQQGQQFDQSQRQQGDQYDRTENRLINQFGLQFGAGREDAANQVKQWAAQFAANRAEANARIGLAGRAQANDDTRLGMAQAEAQAAAQAGPALPKLSPGWMYTDSAAGTVAAPIPGTADYAKVVDTDNTLQTAQRRVATMVDMMLGKEQTTPQGNKVRYGGAGTELWGDQQAVYSSLRGAIIADLGKAREQGVIDQKEYDRLAEQLADPTTIGSGFRRNKSMAKGYEEIGNQIKQKLDSHRQANPWLMPKLPPGAQVTQ
jgi:hypothetical protein